MIFLRHHLHEELKTEYLTVKDTLILWENLKQWYKYQKTVILLKACYDWIHRRLQDFKSVNEYNSVLFKISSQLKLYGEKITDDDMLEKTYSTFHASNVLLQQQYRERRFTKYSKLISYLLLAEQNNELLMKNHQSRPTGSVPFPEVNVSSFHGHGRGRGRACSGGRGYGRNRNNYHNHNGHNSSLIPRRNSTPSHQKWNSNATKQAKGKTLQNKPPEIYDDKPCYRCGMKVDITHLDVSDFFADTSGSIDHLIGDGNVHTS
ncbi:uncharacterized protein LOC132277659 [Cornus florida]|uniref:uncharacterized protein LOC132277659 n=1 Tax=Cornus florida TaxID=4283 RepID=UPI00289F41B8|nr:uncharacterized protein LOC132277659 [Cornus florida]